MVRRRRKSNPWPAVAVLSASIGGMAWLLGYAPISYVAGATSKPVSKSQATQLVADIAAQHGFEQPIEVRVQDTWCGPSSPAIAGYDSVERTHYICTTDDLLKEGVLRHETRHIAAGHLEVDKRDVLARTVREWDATLYQISVRDAH